jgi:hypothetical protein
MKTIGTMLVAAVATAGMVATAQAQSHSGRSAGASGGARIHTTGTHGTWSGGGHWRGGGGHWGGGRWGGARWGLYIGAPLLWSSWYWGGYPYYAGYPYYYDNYWYPRSTVVYDRVIERYPASYPEGVIGPAPTTDIGPRSEGAPSEAPAYRNYCESAKAYFPKVTACPEGWRFVPAR